MDGFRVEIFTPREKRAAAVAAIALLVLGLSVTWALRAPGHAPAAAPQTSSLQRFAEFSFLAGSEAFALAGVSEHPHNQLESLARVSAYRTTDGARSWQRLRLPAGARGLPLSIQAMSERQLLLTMGDPVGANPSSFWLSQDGGEAWRRFATPRADHGSYLVALDAGTAYLVSHAYSSDGGPTTALDLYWTADGGSSWRHTLSLDSAEPAAGDLQIDRPYAGPVFFTPREGWIMSGSFVPRPGGSRPVLLHTGDSGVSWREVPLPAPPDKSFTLSLPVFPDGGPHGFLALGGAAGMLVYETLDGGATWAAPYQAGVPWFEVGPDRWVFSDGRFLETSRDWARTWTSVVAQLPPGLALGHVVAPGPVLWSFPAGDGPGYSTGSETVLLRSLDGGLTWRRMAWPGT